MNASLLIEHMSASDLPAVSDIDVASFPMPWPLESYVQELAKPPEVAVWLVARAASRGGREIRQGVAGYGGLWLVLDEAHICTLAVHPAMRRQGVGLALAKALIDEADSRGARTVTLEVRASNEAAQALYNRLGFKEEGMRRGYYSDNGEDALILTVTLQ
jgi:ribosomal-protein-alanine N-acetyltransferase